MSLFGALRRRVLTPDVAATRLDVRGFHVKNDASRELLETVGRSFLTGYGYAAEADVPVAAEDRLERVPLRFRGFAYEGAAMAFAVRDGLPFGGSTHVAGMLAGRGHEHVYMAYIGVGWAMARVPRFRWSSLHAPDPLLRWLVLDGYGFHQAYFHTGRYVRDGFRAEHFPWPGDDPGRYADRAIDQGIGRALWFVGGTDPALVADLIDRFPAGRREDLYGGAGLAATYAGGADEPELRSFWDRAGPYRAIVAQGSAFAAEARVRADLVVPHTELAARIFCDMSPAEAAKITDETRPDPGAVDGGPDPADPTRPAFEVWRQRIAARFASLGRC